MNVATYLTVHNCDAIDSFIVYEVGPFCIRLPCFQGFQVHFIKSRNGRTKCKQRRQIFSANLHRFEVINEERVVCYLIRGKTRVFHTDYSFLLKVRSLLLVWSLWCNLFTYTCLFYRELRPDVSMNHRLIL